MDVWAGVLPLGLNVGAPVADERLKDGIETPAEVAGYTREK
jgi:hypothetical protein